MIEDPALLAAGYALGTLTPEELAAYRAYLSSSPEALSEAEELASAARALALDAPPVAPPPALKSAIMAKIATTPQLPAAPPVASPDSAGVREQTGPRKGRSAGVAETRASLRWFRGPVRAIAAVAAAALIFVCGTLVGVRLQNGDGALQQQAAALAQLNQAADTQRASAQVSGGGTATLVFSPSLGKSALLVDRLDPLPSGKTYELWYIGDKGAEPAGTMQAASRGTTWRVLHGTFRPGDTVGVTVEPEGGSKHPTTKPIVAITS
jgi:anti-sigma-K factor RskA